MSTPAIHIACPSCGKVNANSPCQRCGGDLSSLFLIRKTARRELAAAARALMAGDAAEARSRAERSWSLHHTREAAQTALLGCVAVGDHEGAQSWLRRHRALAK